MVEPRCSNFKIITTIFRVSEYLAILRYQAQGCPAPSHGLIAKIWMKTMGIKTNYDKTAQAFSIFGTEEGKGLECNKYGAGGGFFYLDIPSLVCFIFRTSPSSVWEIDRYDCSIVVRVVQSQTKSIEQMIFLHHITWNCNACAYNHMSHDMTKQTKWVCAQRRFRSAWAFAQSDQSSLSTWRKLGSLATHWAHSEVSDQTGRMPRLIWVFAGRTVTLLILSCRGSFPIFCRYYSR